jgi:hypothetical protein
MAMTLAELRKQGYQALVDSLGVVGMLRFLQQLEVGHGDYTAERHQWLDELTLADFQRYLQQQKTIKAEALGVSSSVLGDNLPNLGAV